MALVRCPTNAAVLDDANTFTARQTINYSAGSSQLGGLVLDSPDTDYPPVQTFNKAGMSMWQIGMDNNESRGQKDFFLGRVDGTVLDLLYFTWEEWPKLGICTDVPTGHLHLSLQVADRPGVIIDAAAEQTADLQQWRSNLGSVKSCIDADGQLGLLVSDPSYPLDVGGTARLKAILATNDQTAYQTASAGMVYGTGSGGAAYPFQTAGNLVIQARSSAQRDVVICGAAGTPGLIVGGNGGLGFFNTQPQAKPTVTGAKGGNAALASLLGALATLGLVTDGSSA